MPRPRATFGLVEYGPPVDVASQLAELGGTSLAEAERELRIAGDRLQRLHSLSSPPLEIGKAGVAAKGIAGMVGLGFGAELEIRPKFSGPDDPWQEDLLFLALFSIYGHLDLVRTIASSPGARNTMVDLVGRILLAMIAANSRRPLRTRRRVLVESFEPVGELDPETLLNPGEEGWEQAVYEICWDNEWWATIHAGLSALEPYVRDPAVAAGLTVLLSKWGRPKAKPSRIRKALPPRLRPWQHAYDLSFELARGRGLAPAEGAFRTFGFTVETWRTWEALVERSLVIGLGADSVRLQKPHRLGSTMRLGKPYGLQVIPDAVVRQSGASQIVDAKYKGREERGFEGISPADRYEALAFMHAVGTDRATFVYPSLRGDPAGSGAELLEQAELPQGSLRAIALGIGGISRPSGLHRFVAALAAALQQDFGTSGPST